mmetsp:Transcript_89101/g.256846  ORF Transcript_89101/g.256846 Transcript_89101/m.256846 type:complete len:230 (-) Transcript_89101:591-1280(-)
MAVGADPRNRLARRRPGHPTATPPATCRRAAGTRRRSQMPRPRICRRYFDARGPGARPREDCSCRLSCVGCELRATATPSAPRPPARRRRRRGPAAARAGKPAGRSSPTPAWPISGSRESDRQPRAPNAARAPRAHRDGRRGRGERPPWRRPVCPGTPAPEEGGPRAQRLQPQAATALPMATPRRSGTSSGRPRIARSRADRTARSPRGARSSHRRRGPSRPWPMQRGA